MKVLVIAALQEELDPFISMWKELQSQTTRAGDIFYYGKFKSVEVYASASPKYSKVACASHTTRMMHIADPDIAIMIGICAGDEQKTSLGDLVLAENTYDYETGKVLDENFVPEMQHHEIYPALQQLIKSIRSSSEIYIQSVFKDFSPKVHIGDFACGSSVVERADFFNNLRQTRNRKTIALDMESYAFMDAVKGFSHICYSLVVKSVCDYATHEKNDSFHEKAAIVSAQWVSNFISEQIHALPVLLERKQVQLVRYDVEMPRPALSLHDRELWRRVVGWSSEDEELFSSQSKSSFLEKTDSGLVFYNIGGNKFIMEVLLGLHAYQASYLYVFLDESKSPPLAKIINFRDFYFTNDTNCPSHEGRDHIICGLPYFDHEQLTIDNYLKFRGIGDGVSTTYSIDLNGDSKLVSATLNVLDDTMDDFIQHELDINKEYPLYIKRQS